MCFRDGTNVHRPVQLCVQRYLGPCHLPDAGDASAKATWCIAVGWVAQDCLQIGNGSVHLDTSAELLPPVAPAKGVQIPFPSLPQML